MKYTKYVITFSRILSSGSESRKGDRYKEIMVTIKLLNLCNTGYWGKAFCG
jgi:hypothetical protein